MLLLSWFKIKLFGVVLNWNEIDIYFFLFNQQKKMFLDTNYFYLFSGH